MLKQCLSLLLLFVFASCNKSFVIQGKAPHLENGYAYIRNGIHQQQVDSFPIINHQFYYSKKIKEPTNYGITISGQEKNKDHNYSIIRSVWLQPGSKVTFDLGAVSNPQMRIKKSDVHEEEQAYRKSSIGLKEYIRAHPDSYLSAYFLYNILSANTDLANANDTLLCKPLFENLSRRIKRSDAGKNIQDYLERERALNVGNQFPEFAQSDTAGNLLKLSSLRGKYVLVDFWASWCNPCRAENPSLVKAYRKYHHNGFEIVSISQDIKEAAWIKAIKEDKLSWQHVSDLKGFNSFISTEYHILAIPDNFLLDKNGKILARGLRGDALEKKLSEILN